MSAPTSGFTKFKLGSQIQRGIAELGFTEPRPIQAATIPAALEGRDVLGLAQTGTGKTAAFALPILEALLKRRGGGSRALVVAPTRELVNQIEAEIRQLGKYTDIRTAIIFGGVSMQRQIEAMRRRPDIIVACPGRLLDLVGQKVIRLDHIETLVLDEADHMFDMGFLPDIRRILALLPKKRQNLLFSATMPREIRELADKLLTQPHVVELSHSAPAETIEHSLYPVQEERKKDLLHHLLSAEPSCTAIIFTRTKHRAKRLALQLNGAGHRAVALQGNMSQGQRDRAMNDFRSGSADILVATDIAARGIDVANITYVINYDVPMTPDAYTHRIGRTGRAERQGKAFTFITGADQAIVRDIERQFGSRIPRCVISEFDALAPLERPKPVVADRPRRRQFNRNSRRR